MFPRLRTVCETDKFRSQCSEIEPDVQRLDEQLVSIVWAVARDPHVFTRVVENVYVIETMSLSDVGEYVFVYFTIDDDDYCTLRWVERGSEIVGATGTVVSVP